MLNWRDGVGVVVVVFIGGGRSGLADGLVDGRWECGRRDGRWGKGRRERCLVGWGG